MKRTDRSLWPGSILGAVLMSSWVVMAQPAIPNGYRPRPPRDPERQTSEPAGIAIDPIRIEPFRSIAPDDRWYCYHWIVVWGGPSWCADHFDPPSELQPCPPPPKDTCDDGGVCE